MGEPPPKNFWLRPYVAMWVGYVISYIGHIGFVYSRSRSRNLKFRKVNVTVEIGAVPQSCGTRYRNCHFSVKNHGLPVFIPGRTITIKS